MVSNFDRIYAEITHEAARVAADHDFSEDTLTALVMEIVDIEDQHITKRRNIDQEITNLIENAATKRTKGEEV